MSEISTYVSSRPYEPIRPGSPGRPQRGRRVAVLPVEGGTDPLPPGEVGLLAVHRSDPGLMLGYWNRPGRGSFGASGANGSWAATSPSSTPTATSGTADATTTS